MTARRSTFAPWFVIALALGALSLLSPGCNAGVNSGPGGRRDGGSVDTVPAPHVLVAIEIKPANPVLFADCGTPASQAFTALGLYADKTTSDFTSMATWSFDKPSLGSFGGTTSTFTSTVPTAPDYGTVTATVGSMQATTVLTLVPRRCDTSGNPSDFFFVAPYNGPTTPSSQILSFGTNIQQADVGFVVDTTGSMSSKIANLQSSLSSLAATLAKTGTSIGMGVADFISWPCSPDGSPGDYPWRLDNRIITVATSAGLTQIQNALNGLTAMGGGDGPEPDFDATYFAATGASGPDCNGGTVPGFDPTTAPGGVSGESTGTIGGMGFRTGSLPILVLVSDAESHDAQDSHDTGFYGASYAHGHADTLAALQNIHARVVGIASTCGSSDAFSPIFTGDTITTCDATPTDGWEPYAQYRWLAEQTGAVVPVAAFGTTCGGMCCTGVGGAGVPPDSSGNCPLVYKVDQSGSGLGSSLADALTKLVSFGVMNVSTKVTGGTTDDSGSIPLPGSHTTADFLVPAGSLKGVAPLDSMPAVGSPGGPTSIDSGSSTFLAVQPGSTVRFTVKAYNDFVPATKAPQFFTATIEVLGNSTAFLDSRNVYILVPPQAPLG